MGHHKKKNVRGKKVGRIKAKKKSREKKNVKGKK
jgi:hypothetical protein